MKIEGNVIDILEGRDEPHRICDMRIGDSGWTVPWAYDKASNWLNDNYNIYSESGGTLEMWVKKVTGYQYIIGGKVGG